MRQYDTLWDKNASMAMTALIQKEGFVNFWEIARQAYQIADCMAEVRKELILNQSKTSENV